jgi:hypothetical protein
MELDGYAGTLQSFSVLQNCFFNNNKVFICTFVGFSFVCKYLSMQTNRHWIKFVPQIISLFPDDVWNKHAANRSCISSQHNGDPVVSAWPHSVYRVHLFSKGHSAKWSFLATVSALWTSYVGVKVLKKLRSFFHKVRNINHVNLNFVQN